MKLLLSRMAILLLCIPLGCYCQEQQDTGDKIVDFPTKFLHRIQRKTASLDQQISMQTSGYLQKMARREEKLKKRLSGIDSVGASQLFNNSSRQYATLAEKLRTDTGKRNSSFSGEYQPYADSMQGTLRFLQQNPQLLGGNNTSFSPQLKLQLETSVSQYQALQAKMQDADQAKNYIQERKQQIGDYIKQHSNLTGLLNKEYQGINKDVYYYSQQIRQYKEMLNDPDQLERKALSLLNQLPAFQSFMKSNSQLAGLLGVPANYGSAEGLNGLQTRDQVNGLIQSQVAAGGAGGSSALQANLQSAESQLDGYKDKLTQLGQGNGNIDLPDFKPNSQKIKTFWKRLEYSTNFQTTRNNYYFPTVTDLGLSVGYKITNASTAGVGISYKVGWGNGIQHIAFSNEGVGLRSYIDLKIKGSIAATGGLEYNYTTPFVSAQQLRHWDNWTKSGLIGISKSVSVKSRVFKATKLQLLWDFLSYSQIPKTQSILFRVGYNF